MPPEEHSLLIIGFDGNKFVFNDPDAGVSSAHGTGFGSLTFDSASGRLSTAADAASLIVDAHGKHTSEKRYQILTLNTI
ncbi:MAG: hypothetical protein LC700_02920 [Actinobacteria bacterium]|nr:hypothetical protein [Actinomycetota bacterium]